MSYAIGIDLGTTFTAAAVCDPGVAPQMLSLGSSGYSVPSVLFLRDDGTFLAGEAAELRSAGDPTRVARHFKRRLGDDVPIRLAGTPFDALSLTTELLDWVLQLVSSRRGEPPAVVVLTHPANWGDFRSELLRDAVRLAGVTTMLVTEPAAAAMHYVQGERVEPGELIGVYDLGGGTFDAVVMRRTPTGFETVGRAGGVDRLGGVDFDDAIWSYVLAEAEVELGLDDEATMAAAYDLRANCVAAKRLLSVDTSADIRVTLPAATSSVRLTRAEFERRIRPRLAETIDAFDAVLTSAGIAASDLSRILLVGGSSRIPLVGEMLSSQFGVRVAVDSDPKNAVALGAAGHGGSTIQPSSSATSFRNQTRQVSSVPETRRSAPPATVGVPISSTAPPTFAPSTLPPATVAPSSTAPTPAAPTTPAAWAHPAPAVAPPQPAAAPPVSSPVFAPPTAPAASPTPSAGQPFAPPAAPIYPPPTQAIGGTVPSATGWPDPAPVVPPGASGELLGVSIESGHRSKRPIVVDQPVVAEFATVASQTEPVARSPVLMIVVVVAALAIIGAIVAVRVL